MLPAGDQARGLLHAGQGLFHPSGSLPKERAQGDRGEGAQTENQSSGFVKAKNFHPILALIFMTAQNGTQSFSGDVTATLSFSSTAAFPFVPSQLGLSPC